MANLLCDLHFWSLRDDLMIRATDFSCFQYHDKSHQKNILETPFAQDKLSYAMGRGKKCFLDSKRPAKLKTNLKELEEILDQQQIVFSEWRSSSFFQAMFANGIIVNIFLGFMGEIEKISFDKVLVGKLLDHISQVHFSTKFILVTYLVSKVSLITFGKPLSFATKDNDPEKSKPFETLAQFDPKFQVLDILGPAGRRLSRHMVVSEEKNLVLFWWSTNGNEVFPWAPHLKEEDRANIMVFSFNHPEPKRIGFTRTHTDPVGIRFVLDSGKLGIHYLGQDVSRRGQINVESVHLTIVSGDRKLRRQSSKKLIHGAEIVSNIFVQDHLVILGGADGSLLLMDIVQHKLECQTKCSFVPTFLKLHPDQGLFIAANEKGLIQCFDVALSPIRLSFAIEDMISGNILDLSGYFSTNVVLMDALWCHRKKELTSKPCPMEAMAFNYLLLRFQGGPFVLVRISGGCFSSPSPGSLGPLQISADYLCHDQFQQSLLLLNQLDWKAQGQSLMISVNNVFHKILRAQLQFTPDKESLLEMCLGLFHAPTKPIPDEVVDEFSEQMHDLSRKFFHELLRHHRFTKAFRLAVDLNDYDLFMDIHHAANRLRQRRQNEVDATQNDPGIEGLTDLAQAALIKAKIVFFEGDEDVDKAGEDSSDTTSEDVEDGEMVDQLMEQNQNRISQLHVSSMPAAQKQSNDFLQHPDMSSQAQSSHHELGIPIVPPAPQGQTINYQLTSFNTRNFHLGASASASPPVMMDLRLSNPSRMNPPGLQVPFLSNPGDESVSEGLPIGSEESSLVSFQPELSATFTKTTAAKRIPTHSFQTREPGSPGCIMGSTSPDDSQGPTTGSQEFDQQSIPLNGDEEDIQVIHFGLV